MPFRNSIKNMYMCPRARRGRAHIPGLQGSQLAPDGVQQKEVQEVLSRMKKHNRDWLFNSSQFMELL